MFSRLEFRLSTSLLIDGVATPLTVAIEEPVKWDSVKITAKRDPDYHGLNYEYSDGKVQVDFRCESGVNLLTTQYQTYGNDALVKFLLVDIFPDATETVRYAGKIDFNDCNIGPGLVSAEIVRDDLHEKIQSRWDTPVSMIVEKTLDNLTVTPPASIALGLPGQALTETAQYKRVGSWTESSEFESPDRIGFYVLFPDMVAPIGTPAPAPGPIDPITGQQTAPPADLSSMEGVSTINGGTVSGTGETLPFITCTTPGSYSLKFDWLLRLEIVAYKKATSVLNARFDLWYLQPLLVIARPNKAPELIKIGPEQSGGGERTTTGVKSIEAHYNGSFDVTQGTRVYLYTQIRAFNSCRKIIFSTQSLQVNVQLTRITRAVDSKGYAFMLPDALKHVFGVVSNALDKGTGAIGGSLISKASADQATDGYGTEYAVSSGYQLRNLNTKAPTLSLKQLIGTLSAQHAAGLLYQTDINGNHSVRVEAGEWFYRGGQIMVIDEVDGEANVFDYKEKPNKDLLCNQVIVGYDKFPEQGPGVLTEFNTTRTYQTPIITNQLTKEIKCPLIAAGSAIEEARRLGIPQKDVNGKLIDNSTEGGTYDDDAFILHVAAKTFSGVVIFTVLPFLGFPYKPGQSAIKQIRLPASADALVIGDVIVFSGTANDGVEYKIGLVGTDAQGITVYTVSASFPMVAGAVDGSWSLKNQPARIRTNERLDVYGITDPTTTYNLELSPARMLRRHAAFINSGLRYKKPTDELRCTDYKNNRDMSSRVKAGFVLPGDTDRQVVRETGNVPLGEYDRFRKIFSPEVITTQVRMTPEQVDEVLLANRNLHPDESLNMGYLSIRNPDGNIRDGYLMELSYNPTGEIADLVLWKKFGDESPGGPDCRNYNDWVYGRFESDKSANPDLYRFCKFQDYL